MRIENGTYCVYVHINKVNGKMYVGQTKYGNKPRKRWDNGRGYMRCPYIGRAIQKYGWNNFEHEIVANNLTAEEADNFEKLLIKKFDTTNRDKGYNLEPGGSKNKEMSECTRQKIRAAKLGTHASEATRLKLSKAHKLAWDQEARNKASQRYSGEGNPMYGVHRYGELNPMFGKKHSDSSKKKMSELNQGEYNPHSKMVVCVETNVIYNSTGEAERMTGIKQQTIAACCRHAPHRKTAGGFHWEYVKEEEVGNEQGNGV